MYSSQQNDRTAKTAKQTATAQNEKRRERVSGDRIAFCRSSLPEDFRDCCSVARSLADFCRTALSRVPRKAATASAAPHTSARAALTVFNPLPASPRRSPQTTDKLTNVIPAVTHFIEPCPLLQQVWVWAHWRPS